MSELTIIRKTGAEIASVFEDLAQLRITVFRDFPYLYAGTIDYEKEYLQVYSNSARSFLVAVYDGEQMVGASTCLPLADETDTVKKPFLTAGYHVDKIFYFGESILLPAYRGRGLGHLFFDEREAHAGRFAGFEMTCFCAVERPENHPQRPSGYRTLDQFWQNRGYAKMPELQTWFFWPDTGETVETAKLMTYWVKSI